MRKAMFVLAAMVVGVLMLTGCEKNQQVAATQGALQVAEPAHPMTRQFDRMCENADLTDTSVSDMHFVPNRSMLNGTGTSRLYRLTWLIKRYGGTVYVDLEEPKTDLATARIETVKAYLLAAGLPRDQIHLQVGLTPTKGMSAYEAIIIYKNTRFKPEDDKKQGKSMFKF